MTANTSVRERARFFDQVAEQLGQEAAAIHAQWEQLALPRPWLVRPPGRELTGAQLRISQGAARFQAPPLVQALLDDNAAQLEALLAAAPASDLDGIVNGRWVHFHLARAAAEHEVAARLALRLRQQDSGGAVEQASAPTSPIQRLLTSCAEVEVRELQERLRLARGATLLHLAVRLALPAAVAALLRCGADPSQEDDAGRSPLRAALDSGSPSSACFTCGIPDAACGAAEMEARRTVVAAEFMAHSLTQQQLRGRGRGRRCGRGRGQHSPRATAKPVEAATAPASPTSSTGGGGLGACLPPPTPDPAERVSSVVQQTPGSDAAPTRLPAQRAPGWNPLQQRDDEPLAAAATAEPEASGSLERRPVPASRRQLQLGEGAPNPPPTTAAGCNTVQDTAVPQAALQPLVPGGAVAPSLPLACAVVGSAPASPAAAKPEAGLGVVAAVSYVAPAQAALPANTLPATGTSNAMPSGALCAAATTAMAQEQPLPPRQPPCAAVRQHEPAVPPPNPAELRRRSASAADSSVLQGSGRAMAAPAGRQPALQDECIHQRSPAAPPLELTLSTVQGLVALVAWLVASVTLPTLLSRWLL